MLPKKQGWATALLSLKFTQRDKTWQPPWYIVYPEIFPLRLYNKPPTVIKFNCNNIRAIATTWPDKHGGVFMVPGKKWLVQCMWLHTCTIHKSIFTRYQEQTSMFNWSPCCLNYITLISCPNPFPLSQLHGIIYASKLRLFNTIIIWKAL